MILIALPHLLLPHSQRPPFARPDSKFGNPDPPREALIEQRSEQCHFLQVTGHPVSDKGDMQMNGMVKPDQFRLFTVRSLIRIIDQHQRFHLPGLCPYIAQRPVPVLRQRLGVSPFPGSDHTARRN